jgi:hypothetical protein
MREQTGHCGCGNFWVALDFFRGVVFLVRFRCEGFGTEPRSGPNRDDVARMGDGVDGRLEVKKEVAGLKISENVDHAGLGLKRLVKSGSGCA